MGRFGRVLAAGSAAVLILAACGGDDDDAESGAATADTSETESAAPSSSEAEVTVPETTAAAPATTGAAPDTTVAAPDTTAAADDPGAAAAERLAVHYAGTDRALPDSSPTPEPGKNIWVIPCASAAEGCAIPATAIADAGAQIGWDVTVSDGGFDPTVQSNAIRSAIADGADAIVLIAVDCPNVVTAAQEAKDAGILLYSDFSLDCNEGTDGPQLFDGWASFDEERSQYSTYLHDVRATVATDWVIATAGPEAKVMIVDQTDLLNAQIEKEAFEALFAENCPDCVLSTVEFTSADLLSGNLRGIVAAGIAADPSVEVLIAPYDASISLGIGPAVAEADGDYLVVGYEGLSANMAEIKAGGPTSMSTGFPSQWVGWQTVDELNRLFAGEDFVDQGMGWQAVDADHNIPTATTFYDGNVDEAGAPRQDYQANFLRLWGVG